MYSSFIKQTRRRTRPVLRDRNSRIYKVSGIECREDCRQNFSQGKKPLTRQVYVSIICTLEGTCTKSYSIISIFFQHSLVYHSLLHRVQHWFPANRTSSRLPEEGFHYFHSFFLCLGQRHERIHSLFLLMHQFIYKFCLIFQNTADCQTVYHALFD